MSVCPNDAVSYDSYNLKKDEVDKIKKVKDYLLASYEEPMDMKKLVRLSGLNEWSLRKGFKLLYGMPVYKFLLSKRMEVAKELLSHENLSVTEVAYHLGYGNHSNFINAFKKVMGFPPGKLKRGD
jgi:AraC-like DNA-binding protein